MIDKSMPKYLTDVYTWAYLNPTWVRIFDNTPIINLILWGNYKKLTSALLEEIDSGDYVLQLAAAYGPLSARIADTIGSSGSLEVIDIAPIQVDRTNKLLASYPNANAHVRNAIEPPMRRYNVVVIFFLLHEVPDDYKEKVMRAAFTRMQNNGKIVVIEYHKPRWWHPLKPLMKKVYDWFEPFAHTMWHREIVDFHKVPGFDVRKTTYFGGLYQKVVFLKSN